MAYKKVVNVHETTGISVPFLTSLNCLAPTDFLLLPAIKVISHVMSIKISQHFKWT